MAKLEWVRPDDEHGNEYLVAESPLQDDGTSFCWRLRQRLRDNRVEWYDDSDDELLFDVAVGVWPSQEKAIAATQKSHDALLRERNSA